MELSSHGAFNQQEVSPTSTGFDLDAYCTRVNYTGSREVSAATLKGLHFAHVHSVPFENLDIHLGQAISLDPTDLFTKIVTRRRGGYCYEVNSFSPCYCRLLVSRCSAYWPAFSMVSPTYVRAAISCYW